MKIYVGNLPGSTNDSDLEALFISIGAVKSAHVITHTDSGRSRGFGYVEMESEEGQWAIDELNGYRIGSKVLQVIEAIENGFDLSSKN